MGLFGSRNEPTRTETRDWQDAVTSYRERTLRLAELLDDDGERPIDKYVIEEWKRLHDRILAYCNKYMHVGNREAIAHLTEVRNTVEATHKRISGLLGGR